MEQKKVKSPRKSKAEKTVKRKDSMKEAKKQLAQAEAKAKAKKDQQRKTQQPASEENEQEGGEEEEREVDEEIVNPRETLSRADTQDIEAKARIRKAYKARKERFYRSLKSFVLSSGYKPQDQRN